MFGHSGHDHPIFLETDTVHMLLLQVADMVAFIPVQLMKPY